MKKSIKVTGVILGLGTIFGLGTLTGASTDWATNAQNAAYSELLDTASTKTTALTKNTDEDITNKINTEIESTVDEQQAELQKLLDQYYQMKLDGLTNTPDFKALEDQIAAIKQSVFEAYRKQIDEAFANQQQ